MTGNIARIVGKMKGGGVMMNEKNKSSLSATLMSVTLWVTFMVLWPMYMIKTESLTEIGIGIIGMYLVFREMLVER